MSATLPAIRLKQGATLALDLCVTDDLGGAVDLSGATLALEIFDLLGNSIAVLTPVLTGGQTGWATVSAATDAWPIGGLASELRVSAGGVVQISDTFRIVIGRPVT